MNPNLKLKKKKKKLKLYGYKLQFNQSFLGKSALTSLKGFLLSYILASSVI